MRSWRRKGADDDLGFAQCSRDTQYEGKRERAARELVGNGALCFGNPHLREPSGQDFVADTGNPVTLLFDPELPFGAQLTGARAGSLPIAANLEQNRQDTHARLQISLPHGDTLLTIGYVGGVAIVPAPPQPSLGEPSTAIKVTGVSLQDRVLTIELDRLASAQSSFELRTPWAIKDAQGADFAITAPSVYRFTVNATAQDGRHEYERSKVVVRFAAIED